MIKPGVENYDEPLKLFNVEKLLVGVVQHAKYKIPALYLTHHYHTHDGGNDYHLKNNDIQIFAAKRSFVPKLLNNINLNISS